MDDEVSSGSPVEAATDGMPEPTADAFELLGNETRLAILLALWDAEDFRPFPLNDSDTPVSFSELFDRVDHDVSSNFNYHLEKLEGQFVNKTDEGYELTASGLKLVRTIISGAGVDEKTVERTTIDWDCGLCGAPTAVVYREGSVYHVCTNCEGTTTHEEIPGGVLNVVNLDPAGVDGRTAAELLAASGVKTDRHIRTMYQGLCGTCSGRVDARILWCEDHEEDGLCEHCGQSQAIMAFFHCPVCKDHHYVPPTMLAVYHPATIAFYYDHGVSLEWRADDLESIKRVVELMMKRHEMAVVSEDPLRVTVTVPYEGDSVQLTYDETATVVDVER